MSDTSFDAGASAPIRLRIALALKVRTRLPMAAQVDHTPPLLPLPEWEIQLENVGLDGLYRALLIAVKGNEVKMLTNFTMRPTGSPYLSAPGPSLILSDARSQPLAESIKARLANLQFVEGGGGRETASDGAVHFLTLHSGQVKRRTALYFDQYPATSNRWIVPIGIDEPRWQAIRTVYEIWREILSDPVLTIAQP